MALTKQQKAGHKAWVTIRANKKKRSDAAKKAWKTRRANAAS